MINPMDGCPIEFSFISSKGLFPINVLSTIKVYFMLDVIDFVGAMINVKVIMLRCFLECLIESVSRL
jgi:hypothetical protein